MVGPSIADESIARAVRAAESAWPHVDVAAEDFVRHLGAVLSRNAELSIDDLAVGDLYLAYACARGVVAAVAAFEEACIAQVPLFVGHLSREPDFVAEVQQHLRAQLLVGSAERTPRILQYSGTGPLVGWVRVAAVRAALDLLDRSKPRAASTNDDAVLGKSVANPELDFFRAHYRAEFTDALSTAIAALDAEDRLALRLHHAEGMTVDALATLFKIGRSTLVRRLAHARDRLAKRTRAELTHRLRLHPAEFDSIVGMLMSQFDVSFVRLLRGAEKIE